MSLINLSVKHGRTLDEARTQLEASVSQVHGAFAALVHKVDWNADRTSAKLSGLGFHIEVHVDSESVHVTGDVPLLGRLLSSPVVAGLKNVLEKNFQKKLS